MVNLHFPVDKYTPTPEKMFAPNHWVWHGAGGRRQHRGLGYGTLLLKHSVNVRKYLEGSIADLKSWIFTVPDIGLNILSITV